MIAGRSLSLVRSLFINMYASQLYQATICHHEYIAQNFGDFYFDNLKHLKYEHRVILVCVCVCLSVILIKKNDRCQKCLVINVLKSWELLRCVLSLLIYYLEEWLACVKVFLTHISQKDSQNSNKMSTTTSNQCECVFFCLFYYY